MRGEDDREHGVARRFKTSRDGVAVCDGYRAYDKLNRKLQRNWTHPLRKADFPEDFFDSDEEYGGIQNIRP